MEEEKKNLAGSKPNAVEFLYKTMVERDPSKRRVKPVQNAELLDIPDIGADSDDSDFEVGEESDEGESGDESGSEGSSSSDSGDEEEENEVVKDHEKLSNGDVIDSAKETTEKLKKSVSDQVICSVCLSSQSNQDNEVIECDGCGVLVHEGCYGVSDSYSIDSFCSATSMEPWYCDACKAGVKNPHCELCPSQEGVFKGTVSGMWVHLVCSLYVPGISFGDVDSLSKVSLFEISYNRYGSRLCSLCTDPRLAGTGICIECDAGMCKTFFHVTCAQREGLLSEAHLEEAEQADPFYAHCKLHTDKTVMRRRKTAHLTLVNKMKHWTERQAEIKASVESGTAAEHVKKNYLRVQRKKAEYLERAKGGKEKSLWYPAEKVQRLLTTSSAAMKSLVKKAELMGIDLKRMEEYEAQEDALIEVSKKWNVNPSFSLEFVGYFLDREKRVEALQLQNQELIKESNTLQEREADLQAKITEFTEKQKSLKSGETSLRNTAASLLSFLKKLSPENDKKFVIPPRLDAKNYTVKKGPENVAENLKKLTSMNGLGPVTTKQCTECLSKSDAHLMTQCDECLRFYHISCLSPPLTRLPKKSKKFGWRCSECDRVSPEPKAGQTSDLESSDLTLGRPKRARIATSHHEIDDSIRPKKKRGRKKTKTAP